MVNQGGVLKSCSLLFITVHYCSLLFESVISVKCIKSVISVIFFKIVARPHGFDIFYGRIKHD